MAGTGGGVHAVARGGGGGGAARGRAATSALPTLRFDALLGELVRTLASKLVCPSRKHAHTKSSIRVPHVWVCSTCQAAFAPNFGFELPPYFLNNARAIATLEGMALSADPSFDVLKVVYPFALRRLLADPRGSPLLRQTLRSLTRDARGVPDLGRLRALLLDSAALSGRSRTAIMLDAALTRGGRAFACDFVRAWLRARVPWLRGVWAAWRTSWRTPAETV